MSKEDDIEFEGMTLIDEEGKELKLESLYSFEGEGYPGRRYMVFTKADDSEDEEMTLYVFYYLLSEASESMEGMKLLPVEDPEELDFVYNAVKEMLESDDEEDE